MLRILAILAFVLATTTIANALPVPFIALAFALEATSFIAIALTAVINIGLAVGLSYLAKALAPKPEFAQDIASLPGGTTGKLQAGGAVPRTWMAGRSMTAGSLVYGNTYGPDAAKAAAIALSKTTAASGTTPNAYLVQVVALSDIPVTGLVGLLVGGVAVTWNSSATPSFEGIAIPEYAKDGKDYLWVRFYAGTQVAADPQLIALYGSDPDRPYTSARIGTGVAYAVVTALVNQDLFSGFPQCKFILDGIKLYDRRYDSSVGGSGSQRWSTPSTWALTGNPVVVAENVLRGISYGGKWVYGAQTVTATQLPSASWTAAASECDTPIDLAVGGTELQFYGSGEIRFDVEPASMLEELLKACNGRLAEIGGAYKIRAGAAGSAVFSFTDADILSTEQQTFDPFPSLGQTINAVTAKYVSPAEAWNPKDAAPLYDSALEALDGGRRQPVDVNYSFVTSGTAVQRLMKSERDNQRAFRRHALPMPPDAFVLEPLDVVSWTSARNGYSSKLFEIITADDLPNLNMGLAIKEIDPNAYDWTASTDEVPVVDGSIAILRPAGQPIVDWFAIPYILTSGGVSRAAIELGWDPNTDDIDGVQYEIRLTATAVVVLSGQTDQFGAGAIIVSQNLLPNTAYEARGRYRAISARPTIWSDWLAVTTPNILLSIVDFETALRDNVTSQFKTVTDSISATAQLIASLAAEQDAANWIDKITVTSTVSASITENATIVATIDGKLAAQYLVTLDVNGYVSGFKAYNDGSSADFILITDNFQIASPGIFGGDPVPVFQIANVGGSAKLALRGDMYIDGGITAAAIAAGSITAVKMAVGAIAASDIIADDIIVTNHLIANGVSQIWATSGGSVGASGGDLISQTFTPTVGRVVIHAECNAAVLLTAGAGVGSGHMNLYVDGALYTTRKLGWYVVGGNNNVPSGTADMYFACTGSMHIQAQVDLTPNVSHTVLITVDTSSSTSGGFDNGNIVVNEAKR